MKKSKEQIIKETYTVAQVIVAFLDEKPLLKSITRTQLKDELNSICKARKISIYANIVIDYLDKKNCLMFKSNGCEIKERYDKEEIAAAILDYKDRNNSNRKEKSEYNQTRITRTINRTEQGNKKLIPLTIALSKMTIGQRIEGIPVKELIDFLRNEWGYQITCRKEVTIIQEF